MKHGGGIVTVSVGSAALGSGRLAVFDGIMNSALCQSWWKCLAMSLCYKAQTHLGYGAGQWSKIHQQGHLRLAQKKPLCGLKSERKPVVCAQKNLPRVKKSRPKSKSVSELFHSVPRLVCTGSLPRMVLCLNFCDRLYSCLWASRDVVAAAFKWHYNSAFPFNLFVWDDPHLPKTTRCQFDKS